MDRTEVAGNTYRNLSWSIPKLMSNDGLRSRRPSNNSGSRAKYWVFTINNPTEEETESFNNALREEKISYYCFGKEIGEQGTRHLQGYLELPQRRRINWLKRLWPRAHFEVRRGNASQARDYCRKDGDFREEGEISRIAKGERSDINELVSWMQYTFA